MDKEKLRNYAKLLARSGLNVKKGQEVIIRTAPEQLDFLEMLVEEMYLAGASKVRVKWHYDPISRLNIQYQDVDTLGRVEKWEEEEWKHQAEVLPANIYLDSDDPNGMDGIDHAKHGEAQRRVYSVIKKYRDSMENKYQWCVAAVPGVKWARKVFPGMSDEQAVEKLWEMILFCSRAEGDPLANWEKHDQNLREKCDKLNALNIRRLNYKSELTGTDLTVGLIDCSQFMGGADVLPGSDVWFNANIPSEEVFTTPMKGDAEGIVYATRPLSYHGAMIEDFYIRFEGGKAVDSHARVGEDALKAMLSMDEGSCMLGECALVPFESPIQQSGVLFYNTLFDENASCHLAMGHGYSVCLKGYENRTEEEANALGVNDSLNHVDFMIGSSDLAIDGVTADGNVIPLFRNGTWAL